MPLKKGYKIIGENLRQKRKDIGKSEKEMIGYDTASYRLSQMANRLAICYMLYAICVLCVIFFVLFVVIILGLHYLC